MTIPERMRRLRRLTGLLTPAEAAAEGRSTDGVSTRLDGMQQRQRFAEVVSAALTVSFNFWCYWIRSSRACCVSICILHASRALVVS